MVSSHISVCVDFFLIPNKTHVIFANKKTGGNWELENAHLAKKSVNRDTSDGVQREKRKSKSAPLLPPNRKLYK